MSRVNKSLYNFIYVGITNVGITLIRRFRTHIKFNTYKNVERAILINNLSKESAEILESLLILSSKPNVLNKQN